MLLTLLNPFARSPDAIDAAAAQTLLATRDALLIDVRGPDEMAQGTAQGAINLPLGTLAHTADPASPNVHPALRKDRPLILFCASGSRSAMAGKLLLKLGYGEVYNLGSIAAWQSAGGKVVKG
ncbi:rhodanese-like domain-containing protein [Tropicimonas sp. IMCC34043]|uniref:rhodanese-like domain-containing protein n=1 Tax=Tropicimonas sp. IMCC34043 TaxID=2248760 RepID=UPI000E26FA8F|nr:rhodanese-like domain-containing protein [Tropicimonas sp. IMCC34043]